MPIRATRDQLEKLLLELRELCKSCLGMEQEFKQAINDACPQSRQSVRNLLDYLALRKHDLRELQARLAALGLSSLGRSEPNALAALNAVVALLESLLGERSLEGEVTADCVDFDTGPAILRAQADSLLGSSPKGRSVRIMVTMPSEAADSYDLVKGLVLAGMDIMRVNCAHDSDREWEQMVANLQRANRETHRHCKVLMDLAGPKLRTGTLRCGRHVVHWRVAKNMCGDCVKPAQVALIAPHATATAGAPADARLTIPVTLMSSIEAGDMVCISDAQNKKRWLTVITKGDDECLCTCDRSGYILSRAKLSLWRNGKRTASGRIGDLPFVEEPLRLQKGDLLLVKSENSRTRSRDHKHALAITCTLPEVFSKARPGQQIFFDDGKIEGQIREVDASHMIVEIIRARAGGAKLGSGKGINVPETDLGIGALTEKDRRDLDFVVKHSDVVGLSFVRRPADILELVTELKARDRSDMGVILKIESREAFDQLPFILLAALRHFPIGIMVARGDLAIEVGFERLAEVQEEILWLSEAAHVPVIWATQVLESLAKLGQPSRAEVTDAAMSVRAECVMLNKGEHVVEAVHFLDDVLHRMQAHQLKKRSMLRSLAVAQIDGVGVSHRT